MIGDWRLAEALAIQRWQGADARRWLDGRIAALADAGDEAGVKRFRAIQRRLEDLERTTVQ
jgi:hypothetical protein